jgi:uncharacterized protein YgiB involved in biofilm formation
MSDIIKRPRKRSAAAGLTAAGAAAMLGGCDPGPTEAELSRQQFGEPTEVSAFTSVPECVASGAFSQVQCTQAQQAASEQDARVAPRFADQSTCEEQFGQNSCQYRTSGGQSFFVPLLTGFMIGQLLNGGSRYHYQPLYRSRYDDRYYTGSGAYLYGGGGSRGYNRYQVGSRAITQPVTTQRIQTRSSVVSRGGFGGRGSARSGGGWGGGSRGG